jgi:hypothetical protein
MGSGKPAPVVRAGVDTGAEAIREQRPSHGMSTRPRAGRACCVTAVLVTHAMCWARVARASRGTSARAAWSWRLRPRKMPWDERLGARVRGRLRHSGLICGSRVLDAPDHQRAKSAQTLAPLDTLRDHESGGEVWGQRRRFRLGVTPTITRPVGCTFCPPAPAVSAGYQPENALQKPGVPPTPRPPPPPPTPHDRTKPARALRL